jgi:hypothetical protein
MSEKLQIINKQRQIKNLLDAIGWSVAKFASSFVIDTNDFDVDEDEIVRFQEKVKKQLARTSYSSAKLAVLDKYINYLFATEEFKRMTFQDRSLYVELTGFIQDYWVIVDEEKDLEKRRVLEVAGAHALSIGSAWDFNVVKTSDDDFEKRFLVIWEGDVGHYGGSGTWGPAMCEVVEGSFGRYFVESTHKHFETGLRCIDDVEGFSDHTLVVSGRRYADSDSNNHPSLRFRVKLEKGLEHWDIVEEEFIS